jgi:hypothetical protein
MSELIAMPPFELWKPTAELRDELNAEAEAVEVRGEKLKAEKLALDAAVLAGKTAGLADRVMKHHVAEIEHLKARIALAKRVRDEWFPNAIPNYKQQVEKLGLLADEARRKVAADLYAMGFVDAHQGVQNVAIGMARQHPTVKSSVLEAQAIKDAWWPRGYGNASDPVGDADGMIERLEAELRSKVAALTA